MASNYLGRITARYILNKDRWIREGDWESLSAHFNEVQRHKGQRDG